MNRALRRAHMKRCGFRKSGGGFAVENPLMPINATDDWSFSIKAPVNQPYSDCAFPARPGELVNLPNPELAQTAMAGGGCSSCGMFRGGRRTGRNRKSQRKQTHRRRQQRGGGAYAFAVDPSVNVGGSGPNAAPLYAPVACDGRAGAPNPLNPIGFGADSRAPGDLYSLTANQTGGAYSSGNAYAPDCYRAPGSSLPVYNASVAGFHFSPSTVSGYALPDGVTAYNEVVPNAARVGGRRRSVRHRRRGGRGSRSDRKQHKRSRKNVRK